ncbi:tat pathway signal sequence protein [Rutstroemia sp. NJR-2017a BBW]|nr:tat pathway signal sequence protein [Rutstroemia sp. NJR-2017a BBW]
MANPATGLPDHTTDDRWQMLYNESMHTSIPPSLADRLPLKTLPVPSDPSKYLIQLEIYHQLHCLNSIRQALWLDGVEHYRLPHFKDFYLPGGRRNYTGHGAKHLGLFTSSILLLPPNWTNENATSQITFASPCSAMATQRLCLGSGMQWLRYRCRNYRRRRSVRICMLLMSGRG